MLAEGSEDIAQVIIKWLVITDWDFAQSLSEDRIFT